MFVLTKKGKRICSEVGIALLSVTVRGIRGVSPEEKEKEGYGGKYLQKKKVVGGPGPQAAI